MMTDDELTELIAAIVAARADGDGVLTIAAVRARLEAAKLYVVRLEDSGERETPSGSTEDQLREPLRKRQQQREKRGN
jgi:hypothetical protein